MGKNIHPGLRSHQENYFREDLATVAVSEQHLNALVAKGVAGLAVNSAITHEAKSSALAAHSEAHRAVIDIEEAIHG